MAWMNLFTFTSCLASQIPWQRECQCDMKIDAFSKQIVWDDNDEKAFALALGRVRYYSSSSVHFFLLSYAAFCCVHTPSTPHCKNNVIKLHTAISKVLLKMNRPFFHSFLAVALRATVLSTIKNGWLWSVTRVGQ